MWQCNTLFGFSGMGIPHAWGWIIHLLFWAALIGFVLWAFKRVTCQGASPSSVVGGEAASILDSRFARGELTAEEYRQARQTLHKR